MTRRVIHSPSAERHLADLYDWIAAASSPDIAERFVVSIMERCDRLSDFHGRRGSGGCPPRPQDPGPPKASSDRVRRHRHDSRDHRRLLRWSRHRRDTCSRRRIGPVNCRVRPTVGAVIGPMQSSDRCSSGAPGRNRNAQRAQIERSVMTDSESRSIRHRTRIARYIAIAQVAYTPSGARTTAQSASFGRVLSAQRTANTYLSTTTTGTERSGPSTVWPDRVGTAGSASPTCSPPPSRPNTG